MTIIRKVFNPFFTSLQVVVRVKLLNLSKIHKIRSMKTKLVLLSVAVTLLCSSCVINGWENSVSGDGNVVTDARDISGFTGIHASCGVDVFLSQGDYHVEVVADQNLQDVIKTEIEGDKLIIKTKQGIRNAASKKVFISLPELKKLNISSAGDVEGETPFHCEDLDINISSAGDLSLEVYANNIGIDISSSGDAKLSGETENLRADLSSAGDLNAFDLLAKVAKVQVSSAGDARVNASEELDMSASSAGNIYYTGDAQVIRSNTSSAGDIIHR